MAIKLKKKRRQKASVPERWNLKKHGVSSSFIASWLQCKEKAKLAYIDGYERMTGNKKAMRFGDFFHKCLEIHNGKNAKDTVKKVLKQWQKGSEGFRAGDQLHQAYEEAAGKAEALLVAYQDFWKKDDSKRKWIAREQYFRQSYCGVDLAGAFFVAGFFLAGAALRLAGAFFVAAFLGAAFPVVLFIISCFWFEPIKR